MSALPVVSSGMADQSREGKLPGIPVSICSSLSKMDRQEVIWHKYILPM